VRELVALVSLLLCVSVAYPLEINFSSHTSLTAAHWAEELELDIGHAGWSVGAGASLEDAGLVEATFGGEYQTSSFSLRVEAGFSDEGFFQLTGSLELFPTESFGIAVEATVDRGGFAGASFILRYGAYANEGGSVATGLLELDEGGNVVGQTLHLDLSFLPWHMGTTVSFGEGGFSGRAVFDLRRFRIFPIRPERLSQGLFRGTGDFKKNRKILKGRYFFVD